QAQGRASRRVPRSDPRPAGHYQVRVGNHSAIHGGQPRGHQRRAEADGAGVAVTTEAEEAFAEFKSLVRIHLKQMLTLDRKPPIFTVALLVSVACEQASHLFPSEGSPEDVFAKALIESHGISATV